MTICEVEGSRVHAYQREAYEHLKLIARYGLFVLLWGEERAASTPRAATLDRRRAPAHFRVRSTDPHHRRAWPSAEGDGRIERAEPVEHPLLRRPQVVRTAQEQEQCLPHRQTLFGWWERDGVPPGALLTSQTGRQLGHRRGRPRIAFGADLAPQLRGIAAALAPPLHEVVQIRCYSHSENDLESGSRHGIANAPADSSSLSGSL